MPSAVTVAPVVRRAPVATVDQVSTARMEPSSIPMALTGRPVAPVATAVPVVAEARQVPAAARPQRALKVSAAMAA
jgi:hypothetical protein